MGAYEALAASYDRLTNDVDYGAIVAFYEEILKKEGLKPRTAVDLACGTGSVSAILAGKGLSVIGVLCGSLAVPHLPTNVLKILIGLIGVIYALSNLLPFRGLQYLTSHLPASFAATAIPAYLSSFLGGLFNVVNAGSVFYAFSMVHLKLESRVFVATCCVLILISNFVRAVGFSLNGILPPELIITALKLSPIIAVFSWLGSRIVARCPPSLFRNLVFLLILVMCTKTLSAAF